jgi:hypothetical protein
MMRRVHAGELLCVYRNVYARAEHARTLNPTQRSVHLVRALALLHPDWVFAGISAAAVLGLEHSWLLHRDGFVYIAAPHSVNTNRHPKLRCIHAPVVRPYRCGGVLVTSPAQTLVHCAARYPFIHAMPMVDSALRQGLAKKDAVAAACGQVVNRKSVDVAEVGMLLRYADPLSENGGESFCRAVTIEEGFPAPQLQQEFVDPRNPSVIYRVDFVWYLPDGRIIVLEYDGAGKYSDTQMTQGRGVRRIVHEEREREAALRRAGVHTIIRTDFDEVSKRVGLIAKLEQAGVPRLGVDARMAVSVTGPAVFDFERA